MVFLKWEGTLVVAGSIVGSSVWRGQTNKLVSSGNSMASHYIYRSQVVGSGHRFDDLIFFLFILFLFFFSMFFF